MNAGQRILIIDDDVHFTDTVASFLTARQFTVLRAETGSEGVRLAKAERPDLILMDIILGERTEGSSTIQEIRSTEELKDIPVFILSSTCVNLPDFQTPGSGWLPDDQFFQKPVNLAQLFDHIETTLSRSHEHLPGERFKAGSASTVSKGAAGPKLTGRTGSRKAS